MSFSSERLRVKRLHCRKIKSNLEDQIKSNQEDQINSKTKFRKKKRQIIMSHKESSLSFSSSSPLYLPFHDKASKIQLQPKKYQIPKPSKETFEARYVRPFIVDFEINRVSQPARNAKDNFCENFGIDLKVEKKTEFSDLAVGVILYIKPDSDAWSKGLIIGDVITAIDNQKIHSGMDVNEFSSCFFTDNSTVTLSVYIATPFRFVDSNHITFINNIISCSRRHRITIVRRPNRYTNEPQYGIKIKEQIAKFNNSSLMMVLVLSANETTTTGSAALYVGDIIISVNGINIGIRKNNQFNSLLRKLKYPRNLQIEFIPTSCFRKFNLVEDMMTVTERVRPPLHVQQTQMDSFLEEYYRIHSRRSRSFSSPSESEVTDESQNDAGEYPGAAARSSLQRSSSFSAFSAPGFQQFDEPNSETVLRMQNLSLSNEYNDYRHPTSKQDSAQLQAVSSARPSQHYQQPQFKQTTLSLQLPSQSQYQFFPPNQSSSVSDKHGYQHPIFKQHNTQLQPVSPPGSLQSQQPYPQPARISQHYQQPQFKPGPLSLQSFPQPQYQLRSQPYQQPQSQATASSSQSYSEPPYQRMPSFHQQPSARENFSTPQHYQQQLSLRADYSSPQYFRQPVANSPVQTINRRRQYQQTDRPTSLYNQPGTSNTYQQPGVHEYQIQQVAQYQPFVNQGAASHQNVGTSSYTNDRQRFQEINDPHSFYRGRGQRGRYSRRY